MTADAWWLLALAALIVVGGWGLYLIGFHAGHEQGRIDTLADVDRFHARQETRR